MDEVVAGSAHEAVVAVATNEGGVARSGQEGVVAVARGETLVAGALGGVEVNARRVRGERRAGEYGACGDVGGQELAQGDDACDAVDGGDGGARLNAGTRYEGSKNQASGVGDRDGGEATRGVGRERDVKGIGGILGKSSREGVGAGASDDGLDADLGGILTDRDQVVAVGRDDLLGGLGANGGEGGVIKSHPVASELDRTAALECVRILDRREGRDRSGEIINQVKIISRSADQGVGGKGSGDQCVVNDLVL